MTTTPNPRRSIMQFSLRGVVAIVTGVAILAAILSPWIRTFDPARQRRVGEFIVISTLGLLCGLAISCYFRYRVERRGGGRFVSLMPRQSARRYPEILTTVNCVLLLFCQIMSLTSGVDDGELYKLNRVNWFAWGAISAGVVTWIWWRRAKCSVELCEHGVVISFIFWPWSEYDHCQWNSERGLLSLKTKWGTVDFDVPEQQREEVTRVLELYLREERTNIKPH